MIHTHSQHTLLVIYPIYTASKSTMLIETINTCTALHSRKNNNNNIAG